MTTAVDSAATAYTCPPRFKWLKATRHLPAPDELGLERQVEHAIRTFINNLLLLMNDLLLCLDSVEKCI
jgi:hypothetical protein